MKRSHDLQSNEDHMAMALAAQHRGLQVGAMQTAKLKLFKFDFRSLLETPVIEHSSRDALPSRYSTVDRTVLVV